MSFFDALESTLADQSNVSVTEKGALGYKTTSSALLDLHFAVSSLRAMDDASILAKFSRAYEEEREAAIKWLFYLRDVREGLGERRSFRIMFDWLLAKGEPAGINLLRGSAGEEPLIPFYGRWDDVVSFFQSAPEEVADVIKKQLEKDMAACENGENVSLLAKWLPSINTSSKEKVRLAHRMAHSLGLSPSEYRKTLSRLRRYIDVVEVKMSAGQWASIEYEKVPSKANLTYADAFLVHDGERRSAYLEALREGRAKIHASVLYPYEIYHKMCHAVDWEEEENAQVCEAMWKELVGKSSIDKEIIVVADGSRSMTRELPGSSTTNLDIANSLALYFAEQLSGEFHGKYITFSMTPQLVDVGRYDLLADKIREAERHDEVANTNIEAVFDLILKTAVESDSKIPECVLIISDMEVLEKGIISV